jgi:hypothetical protein
LKASNIENEKKSYCNQHKIVFEEMMMSMICKKRKYILRSAKNIFNARKICTDGF